MIKFIVVMSLLLSACVGVGENVIVFRGELSTPEATLKPMNCLLSLQRDGAELISYDINEKFFVDYVVGRRARVYEVEIVCDDGVGKWFFNSDSMSLGSESDSVIDFGKITLTRNSESKSSIE
ncbi:hypothetical protein Misp06_00261 [Microbulbifer sp. NBRC 101763]|uniref:hypothetical protein n=1 Tax=unclassified Microbulbifer TaxID=2619833 RepID=UPI0024ACEB57|nr:hypothetical protein [Microbulbifer sp. MLAF003]WHI49964.1 hypothetical protein P3339_16090 [Microbulbifer sp. MLAF003]